MEALLKLLPSPQPAAVRYGATIAMVLLSYALKIGMEGRSGIYGFIFFIPAVVASSIMFDRGSGYVAVATTVACSVMGLTWTTQTLEPHLSAIASFVIIATGLVFVSEGLRRALERAEAAARERELLLQEMSHRVKNKFAMIQSIIGLQTRAAPPDARGALEAISGRVKVIASVHDYLQHARHDGVMDMRDYLDRLCSSLSDVLGHLRPIALIVDIDPVSLPPKKALPTGLIVNELMTNAYKYAFPDDRSGRILVSLKHRDGALELAVSDNGVGSQKDAEPGLGTQLINVLAGQLGGTVTREQRAPGYRVSITFDA